MSNICEVKCGLYKHYKGNIYRVIGNAVHTETLEHFVIYHNINDPDDLFTRPINCWLETVILDNGKEVERFVLIGDTDNE